MVTRWAAEPLDLRCAIQPLLVGAEGEVVIDLAEVDRFDSGGQEEWRRLLKSLAGQVPAVTLVDVTESFLASAGDTLAIARNIVVASVLVPYGCIEYGRTSHESVVLDQATWLMQFGAHVCTTCGGSTDSKLSAEALVPLQKASTGIPPASVKVIGQRACVSDSPGIGRLEQDGFEHSEIG